MKSNDKTVRSDKVQDYLSRAEDGKIPVTVTWSANPGDNTSFALSVNVHGELEGKNGYPGDEWRVVHEDGNTYSYFKTSDVSDVMPFSKGLRIFVVPYEVPEDLRDFVDERIEFLLNEGVHAYAKQLNQENDTGGLMEFLLDYHNEK